MYIYYEPYISYNRALSQGYLRASRALSQCYKSTLGLKHFEIYRFWTLTDWFTGFHRFLEQADSIKMFLNCRFLDFDRPVHRFQAVFSANRLDHRVSEVKAVQNIYTLGGFKQFENCRFFGLRPVGLPVSTGFGPNRLDQRVPEVEAVQNIYRFMGFCGSRF